MSTNKPIDRYIQAISSPDRNIRRKALIGLVEAGSISVIPYLENVAREDSDAELQFLAKKGLSLLKAKLEFAELRTPEKQGQGSDRATTNLSALTDHLANQSPEMRARVIKAAVATRDPQILTILIPHLETETDDTVKGLILLAIAILSKGKYISVISKYLKNSTAELRSATIEALGATSAPLAYPFLVEGMNDKNNDVRSKAFAFLIRLGKGNILKLLDTMLSSEKEWMNVSALKAASRFNSNEVVALLAKYLNGPEKLADLAIRSLQVLTKAGNEKAADVLKQASLPFTKEQQTSPALETQTSSHQDESQPSEQPASTEKTDTVFLDANATDLTSADPRKRQKYLTDVIRHNDRSALGDIIKAIESEPDAKIKASMLITLGKLGDRDVLENIVPWLCCDEDRLRASAVEAVSQIKDIDLPTLLTPRLADTDNRTRANAIVALIPYADIDLLSPLKELSISTRIRDRLSAIYAITHMATKESVEILSALTKDPSKIVEKRAEEALQILKTKKGFANICESSPLKKKENLTLDKTTEPEDLNNNETVSQRERKEKERSEELTTDEETTPDKEAPKNHELPESKDKTSPASDSSLSPGSCDDTETEEEETPVPTRQSKKIRNREKTERSRKFPATIQSSSKIKKAEGNSTEEEEESESQTGEKEATGLSKRAARQKNNRETETDNSPKTGKGKSREPKAPTSKTGGIPRGILLHGIGDLIAAIAVMGSGFMLISNFGPPKDEMIFPFALLFLVVPLILLAGGVGLLTGKAWGRHVNGLIFHVVKIPVIANMCLTSLMQKDSLAFIGLQRADFPEKIYYVTAVGGGIFFFLLVSNF
jgi:HEAT repeat protein